jgi:hypothetical protein
MPGLDTLDALLVAWAFCLQTAPIVHVALRRRRFERYTLRYGWLVYTPRLPTAVIHTVLNLTAHWATARNSSS